MVLVAVSCVTGPKRGAACVKLHHPTKPHLNTVLNHNKNVETEQTATLYVAAHEDRLSDTAVSVVAGFMLWTGQIE